MQIDVLRLLYFSPSFPTCICTLYIQVSVFLYHGSISDRLALRKKIFKSKHNDGILPVVVTSYEIVLKDSVYLSNKSWKFLIVDEGHRIKNLNCKLIRSVYTYI